MSDVDGRTDGDDRVEALLRQQAEEIQRLRAELDELRQRVDGRGGPGPGGPNRTDGTGPTTVEADDRVGSARIDRRHVLRHAGVAAAGVAAGSAALVVGTAGPAAAASGTFDGNPAVSASGIGGNGVQATSDNSHALFATNDNGESTAYVQNASAGGDGVFANVFGTGTAVVGFSQRGVGVTGSSVEGYGIVAAASTDGGTPKAHLRFATGPGTLPAPPTRSDAHLAGELAFDGDDDLWLCVAAGSPGTWRRVSGADTAGAITLLPTPVRVYDSRPGDPPAVGPKTPLTGGSPRTVDCTANGSGVPVGATGVLANLTVVHTSPTGFLVAYAAGASVPGTSTVNWFRLGSIVANSSFVALSAAAAIDLYVAPGAVADVIVDIVGYTR